MANKKTVSVCWFRRDLRLEDNAALYHALKSGAPVLAVFIFDRNILDKLEQKKDARVEFILAALNRMQEQLLALGSSLHVFDGDPLGVYARLLDMYTIGNVYTNTDYEGYAISRDKAVAQLLHSNGVGFHTYKDQVIFEKKEVVKDDGNPYTVFTPYSRRWKASLTDFYLKSYPTEAYFQYFLKCPGQPIPSLKDIGFEPSGIVFPGAQVSEELIRHYREQRDFPALRGTSRLGIHLRFGTISIRALARKAMSLNETFLNELIWRDFYHMILSNFQHVGQGKSFRPEYDLINWRNNEQEFDKWCKGMTGYPIVDAGMRELNATGFMHNRVRMITASFLAKHLLIDWRWGEAYFAEKLLDYDFAANNGGWQWAAGSGCDAAPYFRIFSPARQTQNFDKDLKYVRKWVPELDELSYPAPIVEHDFARKRCLEAYSTALKR